MSRLRYVSLIAFVVAYGAPALLSQGQTLPTRDAATQQDIYAIYSRIITEDTIIGAAAAFHADDENTNERLYLIQITTVTAKEGFTLGGPTLRMGAFEPKETVKSPATEAGSFNEMLVDFAVRKDTAVSLDRSFTLDKPYLLLPQVEIQHFLDESGRSTPQYRPPGAAIPANRNPLYPRAQHVILLGDVYFNKDRSVAMTYAANWSTNTRATALWKVFRKTAAGKWESALDPWEIRIIFTVD